MKFSTVKFVFLRSVSIMTTVYDSILNEKNYVGRKKIPSNAQLTGSTNDAVSYIFSNAKTPRYY